MMIKIESKRWFLIGLLSCFTISTISLLISFALLEEIPKNAQMETGIVESVEANNLERDVYYETSEYYVDSQYQIIKDRADLVASIPFIILLISFIGYALLFVEMEFINLSKKNEQKFSDALKGYFVLLTPYALYYLFAF